MKDKIEWCFNCGGDIEECTCSRDENEREKFDLYARPKESE